MATSACQEEQKNIASGQEWYSFTTVEGFVKKHFYFYIQPAEQGFVALWNIIRQMDSHCEFKETVSVYQVARLLSKLWRTLLNSLWTLLWSNGFKRVNVKLLPSVLTKYSLWKTYEGICASQGHISVGYSKFCDLWNQLCPFVLIMRPATDLCWTCHN